MNVHKESFGKTADGVAVDLYTLSNGKGLRVKIMTYGATIISVETPDRNGKADNVTLSLDNLDEYLKGHPFFGSTVGRYANRIAKGKFTLDGKQYTLAVNDRNHPQPSARRQERLRQIRVGRQAGRDGRFRRRRFHARKPRRRRRISRENSTPR